MYSNIYIPISILILYIYISQYSVVIYRNHAYWPACLPATEINPGLQPNSRFQGSRVLFRFWAQQKTGTKSGFPHMIK